MMAGELLAELVDEEHFLAVAQDVETGKIYTIKAVRHEWPEEGIQGTVFLEIEES